MIDRESIIENLVLMHLDYLHTEIRYGLNLCTDEELNSIMGYEYVVRTLEIESIFTKMVFLDRLEESKIENMGIREGVFYNDIKEKNLTAIRNVKINKIIN